MGTWNLSERFILLPLTKKSKEESEDLVVKSAHITQTMIKNFQKDFLKLPLNRVLQNAIIKNGIQSVSRNNESTILNRYTFSEEIKTEKITNQQKSGRCWLFAGLNTFRQKISKELKIKDFELSQNYPMFWDKLEKSNYFLENVLDTLDEDIYSRVFMWLLDAPVQDGGQWDMFANLVKKYGVVPKEIMPETFHSGDTVHMDRLLTLKLRDNAAELRNLARDGKSMEALRQRKNEMLSEIYRMIAFFLGDPPSKFDFEFRDKNDKYFQVLNLTPHDFFEKYVKLNLDDYISVINAPTDDKPFNRTFTVKYLGNMKDGKDVLYLNVDIDTMKKMTLAQIKDGVPVWFGCDMGKMLDSDAGIMDSKLYLYEEALGVPFGLDKAGRLLYGESQLTHAMVFTGANLVNGEPNRWKVENSWGEKLGKEGYFVMSDEWFDEFNYQVVIDKKYISDHLMKALDQKPIVLPPWDPMGSLALMR